MSDVSWLSPIYYYIFSIALRSSDWAGKASVPVLFWHVQFLARWHGSHSPLIQNWCWNSSFADGTTRLRSMPMWSHWLFHRRRPTPLWAMQHIDRDLQKMLHLRFRHSGFNSSPGTPLTCVWAWLPSKQDSVNRWASCSPASYHSSWHAAIYTGFVCISGQ